MRLKWGMNSLSLHLLFAVSNIVICLVEVHVSFQTQLTIQRLPTLREKSLLLVRMMVNYEKRFPEDFELQAQFLELVNYVYRLENEENNYTSKFIKVLHGSCDRYPSSIRGTMQIHSCLRYEPTFKCYFVNILFVFISRDETLVSTELASKLEPAFLSGLRCIQPQIRSRFMEVRHCLW